MWKKRKIWNPGFWNDLKPHDLFVFQSLAASLMTTVEFSFEKKNEHEWKKTDKVVYKIVCQLMNAVFLHRSK